jgi:hypothetical protein
LEEELDGKILKQGEGFWFDIDLETEAGVKRVKGNVGMCEPVAEGVVRTGHAGTKVWILKGNEKDPVSPKEQIPALNNHNVNHDFLPQNRSRLSQPPTQILSSTTLPSKSTTSSSSASKLDESVLLSSVFPSSSLDSFSDSDELLDEVDVSDESKIEADIEQFRSQMPQFIKEREVYLITLDRNFFQDEEVDIDLENVGWMKAEDMRFKGIEEGGWGIIKNELFRKRGMFRIHSIPPHLRQSITSIDHTKHQSGFRPSQS